jgi:hypothetical protein
MNDEWIENELRRLPAPELPPAWRGEILAAARKATAPRRAEWPPFVLAWRGVFARNPVTAGSLACLWVLIFALRVTTPVDPAEKELLAHADPHAPAPDFALMAEQIRLAEAWTAYGEDFEPQERQRP